MGEPFSGNSPEAISTASANWNLKMMASYNYVPYNHLMWITSVDSILVLVFTEIHPFQIFYCNPRYEINTHLQNHTNWLLLHYIHKL